MSFFEQFEILPIFQKPFVFTKVFFVLTIFIILFLCGIFLLLKKYNLFINLENRIKVWWSQNPQAFISFLSLKFEEIYILIKPFEDKGLFLFIGLQLSVFFRLNVLFFDLNFFYIVISILSIITISFLWITILSKYFQFIKDSYFFNILLYLYFSIKDFLLGICIELISVKNKLNIKETVLTIITYTSIIGFLIYMLNNAFLNISILSFISFFNFFNLIENFYLKNFYLDYSKNIEECGLLFITLQNKMKIKSKFTSKNKFFYIEKRLMHGALPNVLKTFVESVKTHEKAIGLGIGGLGAAALYVHEDNEDERAKLARESNEKTAELARESNEKIAAENLKETARTQNIKAYENEMSSIDNSRDNLINKIHEAKNTWGESMDTTVYEKHLKVLNVERSIVKKQLDDIINSKAASVYEHSFSFFNLF